MEAHRATTWERLLRVDVASTRGFFTLVVEVGAATQRPATTGARLGLVPPSHGRLQQHWVDFFLTIRQSTLISTTGTLCIWCTAMEHHLLVMSKFVHIICEWILRKRSRKSFLSYVYHKMLLHKSSINFKAVEKDVHYGTMLWTFEVYEMYRWHA